MAASNETRAKKEDVEVTAETLKEDLASLREDLSALARQIDQLARSYLEDAGEQIREGLDEAGEAARAKVGAASQSVEDYVRARPLQSLAMALGLGFLAGLLWRR